MMKKFNDDIYILIEDYLSNSLSRDEAAKVTQRIEEDPLFKEEVEWMKDLRETLKDKKTANVIEAFNEIHSQTTLQEGIKNKRLKQSLGLLFLLVFILSILYFSGLFNSANINTKPDSKENKEVSPTTTPIAENPQTTLPTSWQDFILFEDGKQLLGDSENRALEQALILFDNDKKEEAIPFLEEYLASLSQNDDDFEIRIETGKIYLNYTKDFGKAIELFNLVIDSDAISKYKLEAKYYLAVSQLALENKDLAKNILMEIVNKNKEPWVSKSKKIIEFIN